MGASSNTEKIGTRYCRKCRRNRKFMKVKGRVSHAGFSHGFPTQYVCSKGHVFDEYPPRARR
jgi:hypothetical protein